MTSLPRRAALIIALVTVVFAATACGTETYAGDSRAEAKVIGDRYLVRNFTNPASWDYSGMHKAHVLGRKAWMLIYTRGRFQAFCVYVWYERYRDDDYAIGKRCPF